jgi:hypothetical protein
MSTRPTAPKLKKEVLCNLTVKSKARSITIDDCCDGDTFSGCSRGLGQRRQAADAPRRRR